MKKVWVFLMTMLMSTAMAAAQTTPAPAEKDTHHKGMANMSGEKTLTGCVAQEQGENEFMLRTGSKRNIELETSEDLKPHVGHTVKVTGTWDLAADKSEAKGGADAMGHKDMEGKEGAEHKEMGEHKGMREHHFKVSKLEMVSETCKMGAGKAKASVKKTEKPS